MQVVAFSNIIYPVDAKGMVEKWLLQVEKQMIKSLRDTIEKVFRKYFGFLEYLMFTFWLIFSGNDRILQHRPFNMGAGLAWAGA